MNTRALLSAGGPLSRVLRGYEARDEQNLMADAVTAALDEGHGLLVEAGTGTGKSLAYLVPAALSHQRVVISTATRALGEQLLEKDLPTLRALGLYPDVALVKGLGNYVCLRRLEEYRQGVATGAVAAEAGFDEVLSWVEDTATGDRSELASVPEEAPVWREVSSSSETRLGGKCRFYDQCFVTRMRRAAEAAQLVVTNHHLFCADMALRGLGGAQALPDYDAVIFDEAHALEDVATEFFGVRVTRARVDALVRDADKALRASGFFLDRDRERALGGTLLALSAGAVRLFASIPRGGGGRVLLAREHLEGEFGLGASQLSDGLASLGGHLRDFVGTNDMLLSVSRRTTALAEALRILRDPESATHVTFAEPEARGGGAVGASPVEIGALLQEKLWSRRGAVVLTSATLSTGGDFAFLRQRLGVPEEARELCLSSPFDYARQAGLYIPRGLPEPRDPGWTDGALGEIRRLVDLTRGGAFVLCTSVRVMRALHEALRGTWSYPTWVQGEAPKRALLERFRAAGDGVLFATASFWEGVDVPGRALRLVIMDKLPFEAPNDPVTSARIQRLTARGEDPFERFQVPSAALSLKQGFGRLVRTRRDAGIVAILDRRILTRRYGATLLRSLPPATRCATLDEVRAFWEALRL
ncbi:MAG: ATP-dependent DNA helicase [Deltaproteobacteria bacterium]|nr:ATP-dependent DNA helicase [Deltaproteobacteria bacterium]